MAEKITVDGRCHCGSIEVTAQVDPGMVIACHCTDCQMIGGGPYRAVAISDAEDLSITGTPSEYIKVAESGNKRIQAFCGDCGTQLYACDENKQQFNIRTGFLNQSAVLVPKKHIFASSALHWITDIEDDPCFEKGPGSALIQLKQ
ncbi:MAG: GFA family protein [Pseudomonadota bacterium]|nr:GFA family protein [Pseudomonadota bacterium]